MAIGPNGLPPFRSRFPPPKIMPKFASIEIAPATVAVTVMMSVSRLRICASSCAITPAPSSSLIRLSRPVFTATAALAGLRPVAKALGWSSWIT